MNIHVDDSKELAVLRQALRTIIALNEGTLEGIRRMSHRQAMAHEAASEMAARRIVTAREMLDRIEKAEVGK